MPTQAPSKRQIKRLVMPTSIDPMLATSGELPIDQNKYTFEYKWDGVRAIGFFSPRHFSLQARSGSNITPRYPELASLAEAIGHRNVIVDGEIVSFDEDGKPSFKKLQHRMHLTDVKTVARLSISEPVFYVLFDVLYADGKSLMGQPYTKRREILEELTLVGSNWQVTPAHVGEGTAMLAAARQNQLEGLVAKKLDSPYRLGQRSDDWIKIKIIQRQEFVVAGWVPESTGMAGRIGAILVGYYDCNKQLRYAGKVGTGLSADDHAPILKLLSTGKRTNSPFVDPVPSGAVFTSKPIVAEIDYRRWPAGGLLQHASFKGIRTDKPAKQVVREAPV